MIVENTFTSIPDMIDVVLRWLSPFKFLSRNKWSSKDVVEQLTIPILLLSGEKDELVSRPSLPRLFLKLTMPRPPPSHSSLPLASALQVPARMMQQLYERSTGSLKRHIIYFAEGFVYSSIVVGNDDDLTDEEWAMVIVS